RVDGVDRNPADLLPGLLVLGGRDVTAAALDRQLHLELALAVERGDVQVGVVHLDACGRRDVGRSDLTRALLAQVHDHWLVLLRDARYMPPRSSAARAAARPAVGFMGLVLAVTSSTTRR